MQGKVEALLVPLENLVQVLQENRTAIDRQKEEDNGDNLAEPVDLLPLLNGDDLEIKHQFKNRVIDELNHTLKQTQHELKQTQHELEQAQNRLEQAQDGFKEEREWAENENKLRIGKTMRINDKLEKTKQKLEETKNLLRWTLNEFNKAENREKSRQMAQDELKGNF